MHHTYYIELKNIYSHDSFNILNMIKHLKNVLNSIKLKKSFINWLKQIYVMLTIIFKKIIYE